MAKKNAAPKKDANAPNGAKQAPGNSQPLKDNKSAKKSVCVDSIHEFILKRKKP